MNRHATNKKLCWLKSFLGRLWSFAESAKVVRRCDGFDPDPNMWELFFQIHILQGSVSGKHLTKQQYHINMPHNLKSQKTLCTQATGMKDQRPNSDLDVTEVRACQWYLSKSVWSSKTEEFDLSFDGKLQTGSRNNKATMKEILNFLLHYSSLCGIYSTNMYQSVLSGRDTWQNFYKWGWLCHYRLLQANVTKTNPTHVSSFTSSEESRHP